MKAPQKNGGFSVKEITVSEKGVTYSTFQLTGYLNGERVRKRFKKRADAV